MNIKLYIQNLKCSGCENTILRKLQQIKGISNVSVDVANKFVSLTATNDLAAEEARDSLTNIGYPLQDEDNSSFAKLKSFTSCAIGRIRKV